MSRRLWLLMLVGILAAAGTVSAQEAPKWSYVEAGFIDFEPDEGVSDDGFFAGGSIGIFKMFHVIAEYDDIGDYSFWNAGAGWHGLLGDKADLFGEVTWEDVEVDTDSGDVSDDGYNVAGGVRWMLGTRFEVKGTVAWVDYSEGDDDTTVEAEGLFFIIENKLGVGASWEAGDSDTLRVFGRFNFGR